VLSTDLKCYYASINRLMLLDQLAVRIKARRALKIPSAISGEQHSEAARLRERPTGRGSASEVSGRES